ncbi:hypothetical protein LY78DRAFT_80382 [Colletotrichum sublineola]|nr:hypothetical protein LY78DRAFT_80382 [Colletotrichum sublineola]
MSFKAKLGQKTRFNLTMSVRGLSRLAEWASPIHPTRSGHCPTYPGPHYMHREGDLRMPIPTTALVILLHILQIQMVCPERFHDSHISALLGLLV